MKYDSKILSLKMEVKLAIGAFADKYSGKINEKISKGIKNNKKISKGIKNLYYEIMFSNDVKEVERMYNKFFGYMQKSKNAKEKWKE